MKERRLWLPLLALGLAMVLFAAGCSTKGNNNNAESSETASSSAVTASPSESAAAGLTDSIVVKHAMGQATLDGVPSRIVVLDNGALDNVLALGVKPVGAPTVQLDNPFPASNGSLASCSSTVSCICSVTTTITKNKNAKCSRSRKTCLRKRG